MTARALPLILALLWLPGCQSGGVPPDPATVYDAASGRLPGGMAAHVVGHRFGAALLGATAGPLAGYFAALAPDGIGSDEGFDAANRTEDLAEAARYFEGIAARHPGTTGALNNRGLALLGTGDLDGARDALQAALVVDPLCRPARENLDRLAQESR